MVSNLGALWLDLLHFGMALLANQESTPWMHVVIFACMVQDWLHIVNVGGSSWLEAHPPPNFSVYLHMCFVSATLEHECPKTFENILGRTRIHNLT